MARLLDDLDKLLRWLESIGLQPPSQDVRVVELRTGDLNSIDGRYYIRAQELQKPLEYAKRFDELLRIGYRWLNMSCMGVHEGFLIVGIELPSDTVSHWTDSGWSQKPRELYPECATSVNLSGPARIVLDHDWNVDSVLAIDSPFPRKSD